MCKLDNMTLAEKFAALASLINHIGAAHGSEMSANEREFIRSAWLQAYEAARRRGGCCSAKPASLIYAD